MTSKDRFHLVNNFKLEVLIHMRALSSGAVDFLVLAFWLKTGHLGNGDSIPLFLSNFKVWASVEKMFYFMVIPLEQQ